MPSLRKLLKWPLRAAVRNRWLRPKIEWELHEGDPAELPVSVPLSHGLTCPIRRAAYVHSFSEIFLNGEYSTLLNHISPPRRWLDIGCHAGYFSCYLAWQNRKLGVNDFSALLIDADPRVASDLDYFIRANQLEPQFQFRAGLIERGQGAKPFGLRHAMGSSADARTPADRTVTVPIISSDDIVATFPPPYDLLKLDVEGAEYDFILGYEPVLQQCSLVLLEWHSWENASGEGRALDLMAKAGFECLNVLQPCKQHTADGKTLSAGCHLYRRIDE